MPPNVVPVIVTDAPTGPDVGEIAPTEGGTKTVKLVPPLGKLFTVTTTLPVVDPLGTVTTICVSLQLVGTATVPLKLTVLEPCVAPN